VRAINRREIVSFVAVVAVVLLVPSLSWGAGFSLFEHGNRAMGMGGAFVAVADDPAAIYWNPAGIAFQQDKGTQFMAGFTLISAAQEFTGDSPFPGDGYKAEQEDQIFYPPHIYVVYPVNDRLTIGGGVLTPFGLGTWWKEDFAGRFISKRVNLEVFDYTAVAAYKVSDRVAVSLGVDYAIGRIDLTKNIGFINPYTQQLADVGQVHLHTDDMSNDAFGWNASVLAKLEHGFSVGLLYRSKLDIDYEGVGSFTQYPTGYADFDALLQSQVPFGEKVPLTTNIEFPDFWSIGLAWENEAWTISAQYGEQGWSSFQDLPITFTSYPALNDTVVEAYDDVKQYRFGAEYRANPTWAFQGGFLFDETPQPIESMSPLLGDGDRTGISVGATWTHGKVWVEVGYMYLMFDERSTEGRSFDGYEGSYETVGHLLGMSFGTRF